VILKRTMGSEFVRKDCEMTALPDILKLLQQAVTNNGTRCAIAGAGTSDESSLLGTRDGLLNLAIEIVRFVAESDAHLVRDGSTTDYVVEELPEQQAMWSDGLKRALYQLPGSHPFLVGCYLFNNSRALLAALEEAVQADLPEGVALSNDPEFKKLL
jgi:hypothetical protein